jgi:CRISPR-associated protein Cmr1
MRKPPEISPPNVTPQKQDEVITQVREYKLITPLFGGGVTAGEGDPVTLIRGTEIRGLLRFWWRACRGGNKTIEEMKKAEDKIWGAANKSQKENQNKRTNEKTFLQEKPKGTVQIIVKQQQGDVTATPYSPNIAPPYAAFPLQENKREKRPLKNVYKDVSFTLIISFPEDFKREVEAALWAWETFGGIGARTRRGFGALQLLKVNNKEYSDLPFANNVDVWISEKLNDSKYVASGTPPNGIPYLTEPVQVGFTQPFHNPFEAWKQLITRLSSFRQARNGYMGRSKWPEAETIRTITKRRYSKHPVLSHPEKFPRAAFGLPIVFHFKYIDLGEPEDTTLQGADKETERLASPLILRPLACKNNTFVGLALLLEIV